MNRSHVTLEQWRCLEAIADTGSFAAAAEQLHKSQSSISYSVTKLQAQLGIAVFHYQGRRALLTEAGSNLLVRARDVLQRADALEQTASYLAEGWEAELKLVVDAAYPACLLMEILKRFQQELPHTRLQLQEEVVSGALEQLESDKADIGITPFPPRNLPSSPLLQIEFLPVIHPQHPIIEANRCLTDDDLQKTVQVVIRDSGVHQRDVGWLGGKQRYTVTQLETARQAILSGLGYGWLPRHIIEHDLSSGKLVEIPMEHPHSHVTNLYLAHKSEALIGPACKRLSELLHQHSA